jgi:hypothetical protein
MRAHTPNKTPIAGHPFWSDLELISVLSDLELIISSPTCSMVRALSPSTKYGIGGKTCQCNAECNNRLHCDSKAADPSYHQLRVLHSVDTCCTKSP